MDTAKIQAALPHIQRAALHLMQCWNAIDEVEAALGRDFPRAALENLVLNLPSPESTATINVESVTEAMN